MLIKLNNMKAVHSKCTLSRLQPHLSRRLCDTCHYLDDQTQKTDSNKPASMKNITNTVRKKNEDI